MKKNHFNRRRSRKVTLFLLTSEANLIRNLISVGMISVFVILNFISIFQAGISLTFLLNWAD